jgi:hypothetical protein
MKRIIHKQDRQDYEVSNKDNKDLEDIKENKEKTQPAPDGPAEKYNQEENFLVVEEVIPAPPDTIRSEVNFLVYPIFRLGRKKENDDGSIEFKTVVERGDQKLEISWGVYPHPKFGIPGSFDKRLFDAIQEIIETLPRPIQNPIPIGSLYSLCKRMGIDPHSGDNFNLIRDALKRLTSIVINSVGTFYDKGKKTWIDDFFHLFDSVIWIGEELPDGTIADTNYLYLGSKYLENINNGYVRPIDYNFYKGLKSNIAKRLYELLGVKFYPIFQRNIKVKFIRYLYDTLCDLIPLTKQKYLSKIQEKLGPALMELKEKQFIEKCEIRKENDKVYLYFYPGPKAKEELEKSKQEVDLEENEIPLEDVKQLPSTLDTLWKPEELVNYFYQKKFGVVQEPKIKELTQAKELLEKYGNERAKFIVDYAISTAPKTGFDMKTFGAVMQYEAEALAKSETKKKEEERKERETIEIKKREEQERKIEEIIKSLPEEELSALYNQARTMAEQDAKAFIKNGRKVPDILIKSTLYELIRKRYIKDKE